MEQLDQAHRPSPQVLAELIGQHRSPPPNAWRDRLDQAQSLRDKAQMLLAQSSAAQQAGHQDKAAELVQQAAAHEIAGTLRAMTPRQLDALSREAWAEIAASTDEEREAELRLGVSLLDVVRALLRKLVLWLTFNQVDIGGPVAAASTQQKRAAEEGALDMLRAGINAELANRADARGQAFLDARKSTAVDTVTAPVAQPAPPYEIKKTFDARQPAPAPVEDADEELELRHSAPKE